MIYVIGLLRLGFEATGPIVRYRLLDTLSESHMSVEPIQLRRILNSGIQIVNADIYENKLRLKDWIHNITVRLTGDIASDLTDEYNPNIALTEDRCPFILLGKDGNKYKIVNYHGVIWTMDYAELKSYIDTKEVANCRFTNNEEDLRINGIDNYDIEVNKEFEKCIAIKYESFIAKSIILGRGNLSFDYRVENREVIMTRYTGSSRDIILPSFITAIMQGAFTNKYVNTLELNEGLKIIGKRAFNGEGINDTLNNVEIPSTVQIVGPRAFAGNTKLLDSNGFLSIHRFKLRNDKTIVLSQ